MVMQGQIYFGLIFSNFSRFKIYLTEFLNEIIY
jgi:hypothetical protein